MFWYTWPSWITELASGLLVASVVQVFPEFHQQVGAAGLLSGAYEGVLDRNGWSWKDVAQRAVGIAVGLIVWSLIRG